MIGNHELPLNLNMIIEKWNDDEIQKYINLYHWILKHFKKIPSYLDWKILTEVESFIHQLDTLYLIDIERIEEKLAVFVSKHCKLTMDDLHNKSKSFDSTINLKSQIIQRDYNKIADTTHRMLQIAQDVLSIDQQKRNERKRIIMNNYKSLCIIHECLNKKGLLMDRIAQRSDYQLFNLVITVKNGKRNQSRLHCCISREQLEKYVNLFNLGQEMRVNGKYTEYHKENDVFISATRLKTKEEVALYRQLHGNLTDIGFAKSEDICNDITTELIGESVIESSTLVNLEKDTIVWEYVKAGNLSKALETVLAYKGLDDADKLHFIHLSARFSNYQKMNRSGTMTFVESSVEFSKITKAFIDFWNEIKHH